MRHVLVYFTLVLLVCSGGFCQDLTMTQHIVIIISLVIFVNFFLLLLHLLPDLKYSWLIGTVHSVSCE